MGSEADFDGQFLVVAHLLGGGVVLQGVKGKADHADIAAVLHFGKLVAEGGEEACMVNGRGQGAGGGGQSNQTCFLSQFGVRVADGNACASGLHTQHLLIAQTQRPHDYLDLGTSGHGQPCLVDGHEGFAGGLPCFQALNVQCSCGRERVASGVQGKAHPILADDEVLDGDGGLGTR